MNDKYNQTERRVFSNGPINGRNGNNGSLRGKNGEDNVKVIKAYEGDDSRHPLDHHTLNRLVREAVSREVDKIVLEGVLGQRYIGATISKSGLIIEVIGTPGNNLGAFLNGSTIKVFGNAQDLTGNTMNSGEIIIHGSVRDVTGLAARGGDILIKGNAGYRTGIHMKEFKGKGPSLVIGGRSGDYMGEYMAGGTILVLGLNTKDLPIIGHQIGSGMHGGRVFVMDEVFEQQLAPGASFKEIEDYEYDEIDRLLDKYETTFDEEIERDWDVFNKIGPSSSRPFVDYYDPSPI